MKAQAIKKFKDKYTGSVIMTEQVLDITEERFNEINSTKFGDLVKRVEEDKKKTSKK